MPDLINDKTAVVGIGQTAFGKGLPDTELSLACQAIALALDDAGIAPSEVDGLASYTMEPNREVDVARSVGLGDITFFSQVGFGGGAGCGVIGQAAMAVATGQCTVAVAWRARKRADPASRPWAQAEARLADSGQWTRPFGILRPVDEIAMLTRRYMHEYGGTRDHLANVALAFRKHAAHESRGDDGPQADDARRLHERALDLRATLPVRQLPRDRRSPRGRRHACGPSGRYRAAARVDPRLRPRVAAPAPDDDELLHRRSVARPRVDRGEAAVGQCRRRPGRRQGRAAVRRVQPVDPALARGLRLLARGEGGPFTDDGAIEGPDGRLPVNTSGGGMSEAYVHGFNLVLEGVRQIRGTSTCQVPDADVSLVTSGEGVPTSAVIFTKDRA